VISEELELRLEEHLQNVGYVIAAQHQVIRDAEVMAREK